MFAQYIFLLLIFLGNACLSQTIQSPKWNTNIVEYKSKQIVINQASKNKMIVDTAEATILIINSGGVPAKIIVDIPNRFFITSNGYKYEEYAFFDTTIVCSYAITEGNKYGILTFTYKSNDTSGVPNAINLTVTDNLFSKKLAIEKFDFYNVSPTQPISLGQPEWSKDDITFKTAKVKIRNSKKVITFNGYRDGILKIDAFSGNPYSFSAKLFNDFEFNTLPINMISFKRNDSERIILYSGKEGAKNINVGLHYRDNWDVEDILRGAKPSKIIIEITDNSKPPNVLNSYEISNLKE